MTTTTETIEMIGHREVLALAYALVDGAVADGHLAKGWKFQWDRASRRLGACHYGRKTITMSYALTERISRRQAVDTITHEIAHAIVGHAAGHGPIWRAKHRELGGTGERTYSTQSGEVTKVRAPFEGTCGCPGQVYPRHKRALGAVCRRCRVEVKWTRVYG